MLAEIMGTRFSAFEKSIGEIADALEQGATSSVELVAYYLGRIQQFDREGPCINAVTALASDALQVAAELDRERTEHGRRGRLHGIPLLVKENLDVAGFATTAGSAALATCMPERDAEVVAALRRAGMIVLGKTNMSEFASSNGRYGYGSQAGLTLNPFHTGHCASGSSSGSAAAVSANFTAVALGTDTFGSIRGPASVTGLAGLRPTHGLLNTDGLLPFALGFDTIGPMSRHVEDLPILMNAMTRQSPHATPYREVLDGAALEGANIAVLEGWEADPAVRAAFEDALATLRAAGARLTQVTLSTDLNVLLHEVLAPLAEAQFARQVDQYLKHGQTGGPQSLSEVVAYLTAHGSQPGAHAVNPATLAALQRAAQAPPQPEASAGSLAPLNERLDAFRHEVLGWFQHGVRAVVFPTHLSPAPPRFDRLDPASQSAGRNPMSLSYIATAAAQPELTVPAGRTEDGLPVGLSFLGAPYSEQALFDFGHAFHRRQAARFAPPITPPN